MFTPARRALLRLPHPSSSFRPLTTSSPLLAQALAPASLGQKKILRPRNTPLIRIQGQFKVYKPITPGLRHLRKPYSPHLYTGSPVRALTVAKRKTGGRNKAGRITVRSVGGGAKQRIRIVDFKRTEPGKCDVVRIEFDPRRSAHIALLRHRDQNAKQIWSYILAPEGLRAGDVVESYREGIPDGLVEGYVDERRKKREAVVLLHSRKVAREAEEQAEAEEQMKEEKEEVLEEGSVAQLEAELAALERAAEEAERQVSSHPLPSAALSDPEPSDALLTEADLLPTSSSSSEDAHFNPLVDAKLASASAPPLPSGSTASERSTSQLALGILRTITVKPGNVLPLRLIPTGVQIHCISLHPYGPMKLVRSAGSWGEVVLHEEAGVYSHVRLQSGEVRRVGQECVATVGRVSNEQWKGRQLGKAGRSRRLGIRPHVRGVAMNAVDHPHGGGRGKSKGNKHPRSVYGWLAKGKRTRVPGPKGHKGANRFVVTQRPRGKDKKGKKGR